MRLASHAKRLHAVPLENVFGELRADAQDAHPSHILHLTNLLDPSTVLVRPKSMYSPSAIGALDDSDSFLVMTSGGELPDGPGGWGDA